MEMILITKKIAEANKGNKNGIELFGYGITKNNEYFCDVNSINTHPDIFKGMEIVMIEVKASDIPEVDID